MGRQLPRANARVVTCDKVMRGHLQLALSSLGSVGVLLASRKSPDSKGESGPVSSHWVELYASHINSHINGSAFVPGRRNSRCRWMAVAACGCVVGFIFWAISVFPRDTMSSDLRIDKISRTQARRAAVIELFSGGLNMPLEELEDRVKKFGNRGGSVQISVN